MSGYTGIIDASPAFVAGTFDAKDFRLAAIGNALPGLYASGHLAVTQRAAGANMSVDVGPGMAFVDPQTVTYQGPYLVRNDASYNTLSPGGYTWTAADPTNPRIDLLCVEVADTDFSGSYMGWKLRIVDGTPSASATHQLEASVWPAVPAGCVPIAAIRVPALATTLTTANITNLNPVGGGRATCMAKNATAETTSSTTYVRLATPDFVCVYVPHADARVRVFSEGWWKISVASGTQAITLFVNGVQLKQRNGITGAPAAGDLNVTLGTFFSRYITTDKGILTTDAFYTSQAGATSDVSDVTTGVAAGVTTGGKHVDISQLAAGWYVIEQRYKTSANTLTVDERRMQAEVVA